MKCHDALNIIDTYLDEDTEHYDEKEFMEHIDGCKDCFEKYTELKEITEELKNTEYLPLPEGFHFELSQKLEKAQKSRKKNMAVRYSAIAACAVLIFMTGAYMKDLYFMKSGAGNSTSAAAPSDMYRSSDYDYGTEKAVVESAVQEADMDTAEENYSYKSSAGEVQDGIESNDMLSKANGVSERKLIKNGYLSITVDDFDSAVSQIREYAELNNGYIENSDSYVNYDSNFGTYGGKAGSMRVRVSGDGFSGAMEYVKGIGKVINENESTEDVTGEYVDTQSRLRVKEQEKERLMMLLEEADSMEDIIKIEARLTEVIEAIESQQARLNTFDRLIEYSTININITESDGGKMTPRGVSFTDRAGYNFKESVNALINALQGFALLIIRVWAPLAVLAAAAAVVFVIYKRKKAGKSGGKTDSKH